MQAQYRTDDPSGKHVRKSCAKQLPPGTPYSLDLADSDNNLESLCYNQVKSQKGVQRRRD